MLIWFPKLFQELVGYELPVCHTKFKRNLNNPVGIRHDTSLDYRKHGH